MSVKRWWPSKEAESTILPNGGTINGVDIYSTIDEYRSRPRGIKKMWEDTHHRYWLMVAVERTVTSLASWNTISVPSSWVVLEAAPDQSRRSYGLKDQKIQLCGVVAGGQGSIWGPFNPSTHNVIHLQLLVA